jgi:hypothetical protein
MKAWITFLRSGAGLAVAAVAFVGLRLLWIQLQHPAHFNEIANAFGSASLFHEAPQFAHSGNQFTFVKTSAHGYALFLCDTGTGQKKVLFERLDFLGRTANRFELQALPWSPDDSSFLCSVGGNLIIYPLDTNQPQSVIETNPVSNVIWLNPTEFAYLMDGTNLCCAQKQADGKWERRDLLSRTSRMSNLTAISGDTIAWLEDNAICRVNLTEDLPDSENGGASIPASRLVSSLAPPDKPPADGLALWLDASKLKQPDQSFVMRLADLSRSKNDAVWNGHPPVFNWTNSPQALNGKPTIHFDLLNSATNGTGLKTRLRSGIIGSTPRSIFAVMRHDAKQPMMVNMGDTTTKGALFGMEWGNYLYLPAGWLGADNRIRAASTNWNILEVVYDGMNQRGYVNGILRGMASAKLNTADKEIEIGLRTATAGKNAKAAAGDFAELLVYDRALSINERKQVEDYLGGKWFGTKSKKTTAQNSYVWFTPPAEGLTSFSYSKESGQFLLNCNEAGHGFLWQYDPQTAALTKVAEGDIQDEQWFGYGESAYFMSDYKRGGIVLRDSSGVEEGHILTGVNVLWFGASDKDTLLLLGAVSNQLSAAIWQYDTALRRLKPLIPYSDEPSVYAKSVVPTNMVVKTPSGGKLYCTVYPPVNFNPHKKYPLVIGNTVFSDPIYRYQGPLWAPAIANCGGYVVIVERRSWFNGLEDWGTNVMVAYDSLKHDLRIDASQVYLFGSSAETSCMKEVLINSPGLWKGVIFLNPGALPDLSKAPWLQQRPRILISAGGEEQEEGRLNNFQQEALKSGAMVEYVIHPGEWHHIVGNAAQLERTKAILHFVFEE